jgi:hypothetical protein
MLFAGFPMAAAMRPHRQLPLAFESSEVARVSDPLSSRRALHREKECACWDADSLQAALASEARREVRLTLTENRSVLLSFRRRGAYVMLRLHRMFLHAPASVVRAVARGLRRSSRRADGEVRRFMNANLHRVRKAQRKLPPLVTGGRVHDLLAVYRRLNERYFDCALQVPVTWGRGGGRARRSGLTFGSYDPVLGLIRIHPVLDRREVPLYFLESVVYHEMLHHHLGGVPDALGRTVYHTRTFREAEARYPWHRQALAWEKENLPRLLRASHRLDPTRQPEPAAARSARPARRGRI